MDPQNAWKSMCHMFCKYSDQMHFDAMCYSGCSCLQLSTQKRDDSWTRDGDWCSHNSARMLCDILGFCGNWECRIDDFMCPRHEYNRKIIPLKGYGSCVRLKSSATTSHEKKYFEKYLMYIFTIISLISMYQFYLFD